MRVLVACEFSGIVREAFKAKGHDAWSCDLEPTEIEGQHYQDDIFNVVYDNWDLIIAHPPCTHLAVSGNRWYAGTQLRLNAIEFVEKIWNIPVDKMCIENPVGVLSTQSKLPKPYYIQPWQFKHPETKRTGLWTRGLPKLKSSGVVEGRENRIWRMSPSKNRSKERSRTYAGIAQAMADQWG